MTDEEVTEAEVIDEPTAAVVPREQASLVTPTVTASDLRTRLDVIKEAAQSAMVKNVDYGKIPGTDKDCLLKPGAEKLGVLFELDIQIVNEKTWDGDHLTVSSRATAFHSPTGQRLGTGEGLCSTREKKYATRLAKLKCPECHQETVFKSKNDPGWYCWAKKGGCGAQFRDDNDQRIAGQERGEVPNPDLPDTWNTVIKMAEKRARVDVVLAVTGASALFTQDVEDQIDEKAAPIEAFPPERLMPFWTEIEKHLGTEATASFRSWVIQDNGGTIPVNVGRTLTGLGRLLGDQPAQPANDGLPEQPPKSDDNPDDDVPF